MFLCKTLNQIIIIIIISLFHTEALVLSEKIPESSYKEGHGTLWGTDCLGCGDVQPGNRFSSAALTHAAAGRALQSARGEQGVLKHFAQVTGVFLWRPLAKSCPGSLLLGWQVWGRLQSILAAV